MKRKHVQTKEARLVTRKHFFPLPRAIVRSCYYHKKFYHVMREDSEIEDIFTQTQFLPHLFPFILSMIYHIENWIISLLVLLLVTNIKSFLKTRTYIEKNYWYERREKKYFHVVFAPLHFKNHFMNDWSSAFFEGFAPISKSFVPGARPISTHWKVSGRAKFSQLAKLSGVDIFISIENNSTR